MDRTKRIIFAVIAVLVVFGCSKQQETENKDENLILIDPAKIVARMSQMTNEIFEIKERNGFLDERSIAASISAITNDDVRMEFVDKLSECLVSLDISRLSYRDQHNAIRSVEDAMNDVVIGNLPSRNVIGLDASYELRFDYRLRWMDWWRRQIKRTAPTRHIKNPNLCVNEAEFNERQWWREIHFQGIVCYEMSLSGLEQEFQHLMQRMSPAVAERIKAKIENYLGRPIRTIQQIRDDLKAKRRVEFTEPDDPHAAP